MTLFPSELIRTRDVADTRWIVLTNSPCLSYQFAFPRFGHSPPPCQRFLDDCVFLLIFVVFKTYAAAQVSKIKPEGSSGCASLTKSDSPWMSYRVIYGLPPQIRKKITKKNQLQKTAGTTPVHRYITSILYAACFACSFSSCFIPFLSCSFSSCFIPGTVLVAFFVLQTFHTDSWVEQVQDKEGSSAVAMTESGHWVTTDQPDEVNSRLDAFLKI